MKCETTSPISSEQYGIIDGLMLGDGHAAKLRYTPSIRATTIHAEYAESLKRTLPFSAHIHYVATRKVEIKGREYVSLPKWEYCGSADISVFPIRERWYGIDGIKKIPKDLSICPHSLLHWFYGDGSTSYHNTSVVMSFSTDGFCREDCELLCDKLAEFDPRIRFRIQKQECYYKLKTKCHESVVSVYEHIAPISNQSCFSYKFKPPLVGKNTHKKFLPLLARAAFLCQGVPSTT